MAGGTFEILESPIQELTFDNVAFDELEKAELRLVDEEGKYTNLGLMLSDQCQHALKLSLYDGGKGAPTESRWFSGSLVKQIDDVGLVMNRDDWKQIRELICAALIQRDYTFTSDLLLNVYPGYVSVIAMGGLPYGFARWNNPRLYTSLRRMRFTAYKPDKYNATEGAFMLVRQNEQSPNDMIMEYLKKNDSISRKEAESILGLKQTAAGKVLRGLYESGMIAAIGNGKNKKYVLVE